MKLNFDKITSERTLVGGLANGEYRVTLTGFDVVPDSKGNNNYQFEFTLADYEGITRRFNTSIYSMYKQAVSNIGVQLGFDNKQIDDKKILTKASKETFSIWINGTYTNFHALNTENTEEDVDL